jgi:hypothetical protein
MMVQHTLQTQHYTPQLAAYLTATFQQRPSTHTLLVAASHPASYAASEPDAYAPPALLPFLWVLSSDFAPAVLQASM